MEIFPALLAICAGNSPVTGEFPAQRPVTRSFDFFFDLRLNKRLIKQSWGWWYETPSHPLWRHCSGYALIGASTRKMLSNVYKRQTWDKENTSNVWNINVFRYNFMGECQMISYKYNIGIFRRRICWVYCHLETVKCLRPIGACIRR